MKITKKQLRQIIKEELSRALKEQGASDAVRASPPRWSTGGEDPWQPTSTRWTGMPSRPDKEVTLGDLATALEALGDEPGDAYGIDMVQQALSSVAPEDLETLGLPSDIDMAVRMIRRNPRRFIPKVDAILGDLRVPREQF